MALQRISLNSNLRIPVKRHLTLCHHLFDLTLRNYFIRLTPSKIGPATLEGSTTMLPERVVLIMMMINK